MNIAAGQDRADSGSVSVEGAELRTGNLTEAHRPGVVIVPQELASLPERTVHENLSAAKQIRRFGPLTDGGDDREAETAFAVFDVHIRATARMRTLPRASSRSSNRQGHPDRGEGPAAG